MASSWALTGGSGDVNPQPLKFRVSPTVGTQAKDTITFYSVAVPIPVQRLDSGNRAQVMEILKVIWDADLIPNDASVAAITGGAVELNLSSRSYGTTVAAPYKNADPFVYISDRRPINPSYGGTPAAGARTFVPTQIIDLTDGAGHGILMGQDQLFAQVGIIFQSAGTPTLSVLSGVNICIYYRWKNVGFAEYVGMVTGQ